MTSNNKTNRTVGKNMDRIMELLSILRFYGMLETYRNDCRTTSSDGMTNDEFLKWLLESEYDYRRNVSIERLIRSANFRYKAYVSVSAILPMNPKNKRLVSFGLLISLFPHVWKQFPVFF